MKIAKMYGYLRKDLHIIEEALNEAIQADHPVLRKASTQLLMAGGKRIRPVFVLLSGQMGRYDIERIKTVAVSLELIHMASLESIQAKQPLFLYVRYHNAPSALITKQKQGVYAYRPPSIIEWKPCAKLDDPLV